MSTDPVVLDLIRRQTYGVAPGESAASLNVNNLFGPLSPALFSQSGAPLTSSGNGSGQGPASVSNGEGAGMSSAQAGAVGKGLAAVAANVGLASLGIPGLSLAIGLASKAMFNTNPLSLFDNISNIANAFSAPSPDNGYSSDAANGFGYGESGGNGTSSVSGDGGGAGGIGGGGSTGGGTSSSPGDGGGAGGVGGGGSSGEGEGSTGYATGGFVPGHDLSDSDSVPAQLTGGEFVVPREIVDMLGHNFFEKLLLTKSPLQEAAEKEAAKASKGQ